MVFSTDMESLDNLLFGGFPEGRVSGIFSLPNIGKSLLSMQIAMKAISEGRNCLYLTSPSEYDSEKISKIFFNRYNTDKMPDFLKVKDCVELGKLFYIDLNIDDSKKKTEVIFTDIKRKDQKKVSEELGFGRKNFSNYDLIIIDSFSELVKLSIQSAVQNLSARSLIETKLFAAFVDVMEEFNNTFILVHHSSANPMQFGGEVQRPYGGPVLMYLSKYLIMLKGPDAKLYKEFGKEAGSLTRRIQRYRWTGSLPSGFMGVQIKENWGYIDLPDWKSRNLENDEDENTQNIFQNEVNTIIDV